MNKQVLGLIKRSYSSFKSDLKIKWVRPEKIPSYKPQKSGDLAPMPSIDPKQYLWEFRKSKELETANEYVKKLFTLEFNSHKHLNRQYRFENIEKVKRHELDYATIEAKIARWTGYIRAWQETMEKYPRNVKLKVALIHLIDKRKKHLKYLRRWDYKKFEWLLEELNLAYKPMPNEIKWVTRKDSLVKLTNKYCDNLMQEKLSAYRLSLEAEQPSYLEEKIRILEFIRDEQKECGEKVTVTEEEIEDVKKQLKQVNLRNTQVEDN